MSPSSSALGTRAATLSMTTTSSAPLRTRYSAISSACSAVSGCETSSSSKVYAKVAGVGGIHSVLRVNVGRRAAHPLRLGHDVMGQRRLPRGLRAEDLGDPARAARRRCPVQRPAKENRWEWPPQPVSSQPLPASLCCPCPPDALSGSVQAPGLFLSLWPCKYPPANRHLRRGCIIARSACMDKGTHFTPYLRPDGRASTTPRSCTTRSNHDQVRSHNCGGGGARCTCGLRYSGHAGDALRHRHASALADRSAHGHAGRLRTTATPPALGHFAHAGAVAHAAARQPHAHVRHAPPSPTATPPATSYRSLITDTPTPDPPRRSMRPRSSRTLPDRDVYSLITPASAGRGAANVATRGEP